METKPTKVSTQQIYKPYLSGTEVSRETFQP